MCVIDNAAAADGGGVGGGGDGDGDYKRQTENSQLVWIQVMLYAPPCSSIGQL